MLITVSEGKTYDEVLEKLCKEVNMDTSGATVVSARAMQRSVRLILVDKGSTKEGFTAEAKKVIKSLAEVRVVSKKVALEILYLDPLAIKDEV